MLNSGYQLRVWCNACRHQVNAELRGLVDAGKGGVPLMQLRFRYSSCASRLTDCVVTGGRDMRRGAGRLEADQRKNSCTRAKSKAALASLRKPCLPHAPPSRGAADKMSENS